MITHVYRSDTVHLSRFFERGGRRRNKHARVTGDLEKMLVDNHPCIVTWVKQCNFNECNIVINT